MAVRVPVNYLPDVLKMLEKHLPDSISTYTPVKLIIQGLTGYEVFVDRWPNCQAVLVTTNEEALKDPKHEKCTFLFCSDGKNLEGLLDQSGLLNGPFINFTGVWPNVLLEVRRVILRSRKAASGEEVKVEPQLYYTKSVIEPPELPEGFVVRTLTPDDAETVLTGVWYKELDYCKSVRRVLEIATLSSVGVENKDGELVAWTLQHIAGTVGLTFVKPEYRGQKLGKYVTVVLAQGIIDREGFCMVGIEEGNSISVNLHKSVGFLTKGQVFSWVSFDRKANTV